MAKVAGVALEAAPYVEGEAAGDALVKIPRGDTLSLLPLYARVPLGTTGPKRGVSGL